MAVTDDNQSERQSRLAAEADALEREIAERRAARRARRRRIEEERRKADEEYAARQAERRARQGQ